jgi:hypothetical protein
MELQHMEHLVLPLSAAQAFFVGYKGGKFYWLAIHSNQANLIVGGLRHRRNQQTRHAPLFCRTGLRSFVCRVAASKKVSFAALNLQLAMHNSTVAPPERSS